MNSATEGASYGDNGQPVPQARPSVPADLRAPSPVQIGLICGMIAGIAISLFALLALFYATGDAEMAATNGVLQGVAPVATWDLETAKISIIESAAVVALGFIIATGSFFLLSATHYRRVQRNWGEQLMRQRGLI